MRKSHEYPEIESSVDLIIHTKSPEKWLLVDRETGQVYQGNPNGYWDRLDPVIDKSWFYDIIIMPAQWGVN